MNSNKKPNRINIKVLLSMLWIFFTFNAAYGDIGTLYQSVYIGLIHNGVHYTQTFLLFGAILVEISMVMIILSQLLKYKANRWANIITAIFLVCVQAVSLFVGTPTLSYLFISIIMIITGGIIVGFAWGWKESRDE